MPAIIASPEEATCGKCLASLEEECIKCSRCSVLTHLRCSDLPDYMLLRLKTSQASYICRACVLAEGDPESLAQQTQKIVLIIEKEEQTIKRAAEEANSNTAEDEENEVLEERKQTQQVEPKNIAASTDKTATQSNVCQDYLRKKCKYGKSGKAGGNCSKSHPKLCFKFLKFGKQREQGCRQGKNCRFLHPRLCYQYNKRKECRRVNCMFYHNEQNVQYNGNKHQEARGRTERMRSSAWFSQGDQSSIGPGAVTLGHQPERMPSTDWPSHRDQAVMRPSAGTSGHQTYSVHPRGHRNFRFTDGRTNRVVASRPDESEETNNQAEQDFLSMQNQLQAQVNQIQQTLQVLLMRDKAQNNQRPTTCRCSQQC